MISITAQIAKIIIATKDMQTEQSASQIANKYTQIALTFAKYKESKQITFSQLIDQIGAMCLTSIFAHQFLYLLTPQNLQKDALRITKFKVFNLQAIRRPTQHTITVFFLKILMDYFTQPATDPRHHYITGAVVGLLSYLIGRPIDQLDSARRQIFQNEHKRISRLQAISVVMRHDGLKGFYRHQNLLGPICSTLYRSAYFGLWSKLLYLYGNHSPSIDFLILPFAASLGASIATAVPDKLRSFCLQVNDAKSKALAKRNKNKVVQMPSTAKLMFQHITGKDFMFTKMDLAALGLAVVKNWIVLGSFALGQHFVLRDPKQTNKHHQ